MQKATVTSGESCHHAYSTETQQPATHMRNKCRPLTHMRAAEEEEKTNLERVMSRVPGPTQLTTCQRGKKKSPQEMFIYPNDMASPTKPVSKCIYTRFPNLTHNVRRIWPIVEGTRCVSEEAGGADCGLRPPAPSVRRTLIFIIHSVCLFTF